MVKIRNKNIDEVDFYLEDLKSKFRKLKNVGGEVRHIRKRTKRNTSEKQLKNVKSYYERHREEIIEKNKKHQKENREYYNEYKRDYYNQNDEYRKRKVEYQRKYRAKKKLELSL